MIDSIVWASQEVKITVMWYYIHYIQYSSFLFYFVFLNFETGCDSLPMADMELYM